MLTIRTNVLRYSDCTISIIKSTPDILYVDLCVISNSNLGPQSMCSIMKIMDYARLDTCQNPVRMLPCCVPLFRFLIDFLKLSQKAQIILFY